MDKINEYRQIVCDFLSDFVNKYAKNSQLIFDMTHDRYLVMHNEWRNENRIYGCAMQLDIIEGQVWIQHKCELSGCNLSLAKLTQTALKDIKFQINKAKFSRSGIAGLLDKYDKGLI